MKSITLIVTIAAVCFFAQGSDALFGAVVNGISSGINAVSNGISAGVNVVSNGVNAVTTGISNGVNTVTSGISSGINAAITGGQFVWDNAFKPALDTLVDSSLNFIDDYFGNILNSIGKRAIANGEKKDEIKQLFKNVAQYVISNMHQIYNNLLNDSVQAVLNSLSDIVNGHVTVVEVLQVLLEKVKPAIQQLVANASSLFALPVGRNFASLTSQINNVFNQMGQLFLDQLATIVIAMFTSLTTQNIGAVAAEYY